MMKRVNGYRVCGVVEAGLLLDGLTVEVIADGKHLPECLLKLVYKCKGPDQIALVTDATCAAGMPPGEYRLGSAEDGQTIIVEDGVAWVADRSVFAGSVALANWLVRTMVSLADVDVVNAVKMASLTPGEDPRHRQCQRQHQSRQRRRPRGLRRRLRGLADDGGRGYSLQ